MKLTKDTLKGALKTVQREYMYALADDNKVMIATWAVERSRILSLLISYDEETNNG